MRNLKFAISNIAWDKNFDDEVYTFLKKCGVTGLEIAPTRIIENNPYDYIEEAKEFKNKLKKEYGLEVCSMQSIWFGRTENIFRSAEDRCALIEYTKKAIDFAEAIGCSNLVFGCPKNRNIEDIEANDVYTIATDFFKELGEYAFSKNVVISIEPNPTIYGTNFLNTTEEAINFVRKLGTKGIGINCDLGTIICNNESLDLVVDNIDIINHIHISEPNLATVEERDLHKELFDKLEANGYTNFVSIEMKKGDLALVETTIDYILNI